jgi:hypothetical protein
MPSTITPDLKQNMTCIKAALNIISGHPRIDQYLVESFGQGARHVIAIRGGYLRPPHPSPNQNRRLPLIVRHAVLLAF